VQKTVLTGLTLEELREFVRTFGEEPYRGDQLFNWIYTKGASSFAEMSNLSREIRSVLEERASVGTLTVAAERRSTDGTLKILFRLPDGLQIESVLIPPDPDSPGAEKRLTLCVSTQVGCPLDCQFCATGTMGLQRNLTAGEIVDQVLQAQRMAHRRITNIVYMGMGEPLLNYDAVVASARILTDDRAVAIGARRVTISTAGIPSGIRRLAQESLKVKLALSLHSLDNGKRAELMPITKKYNVGQLLDALADYYHRTRRRPTFEYIVFKGFNDTDDDVRRIAEVVRRIPCKINLIPYHSIAFSRPQGLGRSLEAASRSVIEQFAEALRNRGLTVMIRSSSGQDIEAACGQLAVREAGESRPRRRAGERSATSMRAPVP
jgi:23S rRNA (adenine2503-C2)-methyltransferase